MGEINIITKLESDIEILNSWFIDNSMLLNGDKCQFYYYYYYYYYFFLYRWFTQVASYTNIN